MTNLVRYSGVFAPLTPRFGVLRPLWTQLSCRHQFPSHHPYITQGKQRQDLCRVLDQSLVSNLAITKLTLQDAERVFHLGTHRGLELLDAFDGVADALVLDRPALARFHGDMPGGLDVLRVLALVSTQVARVTKDHLFLTMHQGVRLRDVMLIGWSRCDRVNQTRVCIHTNVGLHAEVPVVAFLGLLHLRISLAPLVLRRARRTDDGGVHDRAVTQQQTALAKHRVHLRQQSRGQIVTLEQVTKVQDRGLVGQATACQRQPRKLPHRLTVVQRLFHRRIAQGKPLLHEMNPQHRFQRVGRASLFALRVHRLDQLDQAYPGNDLIHLREKLLASRQLALGTKLNVGKTQLAHDRFGFAGNITQTTTLPMGSMNSGTFSEFS